MATLAGRITGQNNNKPKPSPGTKLTFRKQFPESGQRYQFRPYSLSAGLVIEMPAGEPGSLVEPGDYIIREADGSYSGLWAKAFEDTYERVLL